MSVTVHHGDCREVIKMLGDSSIDAVVCDPPYSLVSIQKRFGKPGSAPAQEGRDGLYRRASAGFMGQQWDTGEVVHDPKWWSEVLRVLKPGAHLIAFGGTRTYHRMGCAIEDAGFDIRDMVSWNFATGFPKSHNISLDYEKRLCDPIERDGRTVWIYRSDGADMATQPPFRDDDANTWAGFGTALKPALEPIVLARKPLIDTVAQNMLRHGTGALNIDTCRIGNFDHDAAVAELSEPYLNGRSGEASANRRYADEGSTNFAATPGPRGGSPIGRWPANVVHDGSDEVVAAFPTSNGQQGDLNSGYSRNSKTCYGDMPPTHAHKARGDGNGSAARFFFSAKAGKLDRWGTKHPTVKPIALIRWLVRLVTPPNGVVLDPFAGSGTTGIAALAEGFDCILIERENEYIADIHERLKHFDGAGKHSLASKNRAAKPKTNMPLFQQP